MKSWRLFYSLHASDTYAQCMYMNMSLCPCSSYKAGVSISQNCILQMPTDPKDHNIKPRQAEFTKAITTPRTLEFTVL